MNTLNNKRTISSGPVSENNAYKKKVFFAFQHKSLFLKFIWMIPLLLWLFVSISAAGNIKCNRMPVLIGSFLSNHYAMKNITGDIKNNTIEQMIKMLDPSKLLFYESDLKTLRPVLQDVFARMQAGDCASLKKVYDMLVTRTRENEAIVRKILGPDFRLDETMELQINVKKRSHVKTPQEKYMLLMKFIQFQIQNDLLSGIGLAEAKKQQMHRYELQTTRTIERNPEKLITNLAEAFANALDPHTSYLSPEDFEDIRIHMKLSLEGIGALLRSDNGFTVIEELIPGGGAERSGLLKPKDKIIAVAQKNEKPVNVIDMDLRDVVKMIRGKKGTQVTLTILRQEGRIHRFDITIKRDKIYMKDQEAKITYEKRNLGGRIYRLGIIDLPSFYGDNEEKKSSYKDVRRLLENAHRQRVDGIVLDLSHNMGGLVDEAVRIAGLFLGHGGIVATKDGKDMITIYSNGPYASVSKDDKLKVVTFPAKAPLYRGPLVVLTSRISASASEIVAGALKDYHRAVIVGSDHTFGKGSVQELTPLSRDLGAIKVTKALYFLPSGKSTQKIGVEADVQLPMFFIHENVGETELEYPLPAQAVTPFLGIYGDIKPDWKAVNQSLLTDLAAKSKVRIAKNAKFNEIIKDKQEAARKNGIVRLADLRKEMKKNGRVNKQESRKERQQKAKEQYAPFVNESLNVLLDMIILESNSSLQVATIVN